MTLVGLCATVPGCAGPRGVEKHPLLATEQDAARYLTRAMEAPNPDERRDAVVHLSRTRFAGRDVVLRGMILAAKTDPSPGVRSAAIRALERTRDARLVEAMLAILAPPDRRDADVLAPNESVRWDAIRALASCVESGMELGEQREIITDTAIRLLRGDPSRDVRVAAAALLGCFPTHAVVDALVESLGQKDFGVVYICERSLMRLTGHTHDYDPAAWKAWLAQNDDHFDDAGRLDDRLNPPRKNWFAQTWEATRRTLSSYRPKEGS